MMIEGIDVFIEVVDAQSFARAADRLGMPTTTVSAKVARLEKSLGVTLIRRTTRQLHVTPAGMIFYQRCVRALAELAEARRELDAGKQEPEGVLRITAPGDLVRGLLNPIIKRFLGLYPKASIDLVVTSRLVDLIAERIDLAVRIRPMEDSRLIVRKYCSLSAGFWAAPSYLARRGIPQSPVELRGHDFVRFSFMPEALSLHDRSGNPIVFKPTWRVACDDLDSMRSLIAGGFGVGFLPEFDVNSELQFPALVRVLPDLVFPPRSINFVYPSQAFVPLPVRAFIATAIDGQRGRGANEPGVAAGERGNYA